MRELLEARDRIVERHRMELAAIDQVLEHLGIGSCVPAATAPASPAPVAEKEKKVVKTPARSVRPAAKQKGDRVTLPGITEEAVSRWTGTWTTNRLKDALLGRHPEMAQKIENGLHVTLKAFERRGRIERTGEQAGILSFRTLSGASTQLAQPEQPAKAERVNVSGSDDGASKKLSDMSRTELADALTQALRKRDDAQAHGQATLARIYQARIDQIQALIEKAAK